MIKMVEKLQERVLNTQQDNHSSDYAMSKAKDL
jgi:hypothetical protein